MIDPVRKQRVTELRRTYLAELASEVARVEEFVVDAIRTGSLDHERRRLLYRYAHNWKGSGGSYGFARISEVAARMEFEVAADQDIATIARAFGAVKSNVMDLLREYGLR